MRRERRQHVVEEADAGRDLRPALAVEVEGAARCRSRASSARCARGARTPSPARGASRSAPVRGPSPSAPSPSRPPRLADRPGLAERRPQRVQEGLVLLLAADAHAQAARRASGTTSRRARGRRAAASTRTPPSGRRARGARGGRSSRARATPARRGRRRAARAAARARATSRAHARCERLLLLERGDRRRLREEVQVVGQARLVDLAHELGRGEQVAHAQAGEGHGLRERAQDDEVRVPREERHRPSRPRTRGTPRRSPRAQSLSRQSRSTSARREARCPWGCSASRRS